MRHKTQYTVFVQHFHHFTVHLWVNMGEYGFYWVGMGRYGYMWVGAGNYRWVAVKAVGRSRSYPGACIQRGVGGRTADAHTLAQIRLRQSSCGHWK